MKKTVILLIALLLVSQIAFVMAEVTTKTSSSSVTEASSSWLSRFISSIKYNLIKQNTFTIYGQELGCEKYPSTIMPFTKDGYDYVVTSDQGEVMFVDWFRGSPDDGAYSSHPSISREFVKEDFIYGGKETVWTCDSGAYWNNECYLDIYECDRLPCSSNSDCRSGETCDKTGQLYTKYKVGVCRTSTPTHQTNVYSCSNGVKTFVGKVSYGNTNFCMDPLDTKYLIGTTDQCLDYVPSQCTSSGGGGGSCTPSCTGKCGGVSDGCSGTCDASCGSGSDCGNGVCSIFERLISPCPQDCETEVKGKYSILNVAYGDAVTGVAIENPKPGQLIKVTFQVRSEELDTDPKLVEAGVIPYSTAQAWTMAEPSGFWSIFAIKQSEKNACCLGQSNIADNSASLTSTLWRDSRLIDFSYNLRVPDSTTTDVCNMGNTYWNESSSKYVLYVTVKNGCYKDGYRKGVFVSQVLNLNYESNTTTVGTKCANDFECAAGEKCLDAPGWLTGKTCQGGGGGVDSITIKKFPLTKEEISDSTTGDLISAACYRKSECGTREDEDGNEYLVLCIPVSKLTDEGTLLKAQEDDLFSSTKGIIATGGIGTGIGLTICAISGVTGPGALVGCGIGGALALAGIVQATDSASIGIKDMFSDELTTAIKRGDSSKVGICTAEARFDYCKYTEWAAFFKITGDDCKDGLIILIGGFIIIFVIMNMRKK